MSDGRSGIAINVRKIATIIGAWLALGIIALVAFNAYGDYRATVKTLGENGRSAEQTASAEASGTVPGGEGTTAEASAPVVMVLAEGLNLREKPMTNSRVIKKLEKGTALALVEKGAGWYKVRDAAGDEGWVAAGGQYSKLSE